jgi:RNA polymerase sigma factor (sigma-70 family)
VPSDAELVIQTIQGNYEAFNKLVARYHRKIYALLLPIVQIPEDAEDLTQDTFVQAYCCLKQIREPAKFSAWLCRIARNLGYQHIARKQKIDTVTLEECTTEKLSAAPSVEDILLRKEQIATVQSAIAKLSPLDRRLLEGFYFDGKSYKELSHAHGLSFRAIANRLYKARRFLIEKIKHILQAIVLFFALAAWRKAIAKGVPIMSISKIEMKAIIIIVLVGALAVGIKFGAKVTSPFAPKHSEVSSVSPSKDTSYNRAHSPSTLVQQASSNSSILNDILSDYEITSLSREISENLRTEGGETEMEEFNSPMPDETSRDTDNMQDEEQKEESTQDIQFDSGYLSPVFVTDEERKEAALEKPYILIYDGQISNQKDMFPLLEQIAISKYPLLVIAGGLPGDSLKVLEVNKVRETLKVAAVQAPGYGYERTNRLRDIAMKTGGMVISNDMNLKYVTLNDLGTAQRVVIDSKRTTISP